MVVLRKIFACATFLPRLTLGANAQANPYPPGLPGLESAPISCRSVCNPLVWELQACMTDECTCKQSMAWLVTDCFNCTVLIADAPMRKIRQMQAGMDRYSSHCKISQNLVLNGATFRINVTDYEISAASIVSASILALLFPPLLCLIQIILMS
ncbi:hypothetical protein BDV93DRAFT_521176 [Ceratobasidium sp. AG-I]|nr:hypothetical protein BDV93DRAFT_521176 [Ceratobasidium sp. AG-I]